MDCEFNSQIDVLCEEHGQQQSPSFDVAGSSSWSILPVEEIY